MSETEMLHVDWHVSVVIETVLLFLEVAPGPSVRSKGKPPDCFLDCSLVYITLHESQILSIHVLKMPNRIMEPLALSEVT